MIEHVATLKIAMMMVTIVRQENAMVKEAKENVSLKRRTTKSIFNHFFWFTAVKKPREVYVPHEDEMFGTGISAGINFDQFDKIEVKVSGDDTDVILPLERFESAGWKASLVRSIKRSGYKKPTPIQKYAIPLITANRDLMGCAQTGSGKTVAFVLPILNKILTENCASPSNQPLCLIIAPTRELVIQIYEEICKFANESWVKVAFVYGDSPSTHRDVQLAKESHILVATPGRLMDYVGKSMITFESLKHFIIDNADKVVQSGFKDLIGKIRSHATFNKEVCQTLMFSATFPDGIQRLASTYLQKHVYVAIGIVGRTPSDVDQQFIEVYKFKKDAKLIVSHSSSDVNVILISSFLF